ncbi:unnamed protein product [Prunus armeniaca]
MVGQNASATRKCKEEALKVWKHQAWRGSGKMDRGVETSNGGYSDSGYLGGCERSSHKAPATESGHMPIEHMVSQSSDDYGGDIIAPRKKDVMGKEFKMIKLAEEYYMSYAKGIGFSVRKDKLVRNSEGKHKQWECEEHCLEHVKHMSIWSTNVAEAAFFYLKAKGAMDPEFFCKFSVDEENRLGNMFWRDFISLLDYIAYGDVLIFNNTYKTNDETFETYKWLLETFMTSMKDKKPISILTDGDEAMRKVIDDACIWEPFALDEFEKKWEVLRERASTPKQKEWLEMMYVKRDPWAESCMIGKFLGGLCYVLLTKLEQQASLIYTHRCIVLVRHEIESCSTLTYDNVMHNFEGRVYVLSKYGEPHNNWTCVYHGGENMRIECGCRKYESEGIPCCHLFYVMKCEHLTEIPPALIMKRWTKSAQTDTCMEFIGKGEDTTNEVVEMARYGSLSDMSNKQKEEETSRKLGTVEQCPLNIVKDPNIVKTKGTQARQGGMRKH